MTTNIEVHVGDCIAFYNEESSTNISYGLITDVSPNGKTITCQTLSLIPTPQAVDILAEFMPWIELLTATVQLSQHLVRYKVAVINHKVFFKDHQLVYFAGMTRAYITKHEHAAFEWSLFKDANVFFFDRVNIRKAIDYAFVQHKGGKMVKTAEVPLASAGSFEQIVAFLGDGLSPRKHSTRSRQVCSLILEIEC